MTATSQHGFHPDAESLSAFSEQALSERERGEVLAHLAVCGRCRQVVALAREAADADEVEAAVPTRKTTAPNAWWRQWRLVWVPTAVVAAFAAASISVYIERADRHGPDIKIAEQNPTVSATPPSTPTPTEQAKVEPPAAASPATPPAEHSAAQEPTRAPAPPVVKAQMPEESRAPEPGVSVPGATDQQEFRREAPRMSHQKAMQAHPELTAGAMHPDDSQQTSGAAEAQRKQAEEHRQTEVDTSRMRSFKAKAAPVAVRGTNSAQPANATQTVTVTAAPPVETEPTTPAEPAPMLGLKRVWDVPAVARRIQLPSGLASVSIASGGHLLLAIDKAGALFLSEDRGVTWERIAMQWTGRAIEVHRQVAASGGMPTAPATQNATTGGSSPDTGAASQPTVLFELANDENQTWVSTDGRTWTPK